MRAVAEIIARSRRLDRSHDQLKDFTTSVASDSVLRMDEQVYTAWFDHIWDITYNLYAQFSGHLYK